MQFAISYVDFFIEHLALAWPLLCFLALIIAALGFIVGLLESWALLDALYWAFITATTVGYGDIRPVKGSSRALAVMIALIGVTFTGILVALAINAASLAFSEVHPTPPLERIGSTAPSDNQ